MEKYNAHVTTNWPMLVYLDLLKKKLLECQFETSWKTQVYIVEGNSKMYIEITYIS